MALTNFSDEHFMVKTASDFAVILSQLKRKYSLIQCHRNSAFKREKFIRSRFLKTTLLSCNNAQFKELKKIFWLVIFRSLA